MNKFSLRAVCAAASLAALGMPMGAHAESVIQTGAGALTASARLDFRVTIPRMLFLQVGTGTPMATNTGINLIDFVVPAANAGDGTPITATAGSGDLGSGTVTARVLGNAGAVTLTSTTLGALTNGVDTLSFSQIGTAATANTTGSVLAAPALADGATTTTVVPAAASIVNRDARWTFSYLNAALVPPGTYGGAGTNNGRVTYTASMP